MAAKRKPPVTSARRRQDRQAGKGAASKPSPRQTAAGGRGAQQGPLKPGTRTSGSGMVNANKPYMQRIQAKATELRQQTARGPRAAGQRATTLPNSARAGRNLIREGAQRLRTIGDSGQVRAAVQRGKQIAEAGKAARAAKLAGKALTAARLGSMATPVGVALAVGSLAKYGVSKEEVKRTKGALPGKQTNRRGGGSVASQQRASRAKAAAAGSTSKFKGARDTAFKKAAAIKGSPVVGPRKSFNDTFRAARKAGKKEFTWKGKRYNTKIKGEK